MLYRFLRRASVNGFFRELPPVDASQSSDLLLHRFENTPGSENLREGHKVRNRLIAPKDVNLRFPKSCLQDTV